MLILAKTVKGKEYAYSARSARKVSARSAEKILQIVNQYAFQLDTSKGEIWHIYDVGVYDVAYDYAMCQSFKIRNGVVSATIA